MKGWVNGWMDGWMDGWTDGRMDGWTDEGLGERMDEWMDGKSWNISPLFISSLFSLCSRLPGGRSGCVRRICQQGLRSFPQLLRPHLPGLVLLDDPGGWNPEPPQRHLLPLLRLLQLHRRWRVSQVIQWAEIRPRVFKFYFFIFIFVFFLKLLLLLLFLLFCCWCFVSLLSFLLKTFSLLAHRMADFCCLHIILSTEPLFSDFPPPPPPLYSLSHSLYYPSPKSHLGFQVVLWFPSPWTGCLQMQ